MQDIADTQKDLEIAKQTIDNARRNNDLELMAKYQYSVIPKLEATLLAQNQLSIDNEPQLLKNKVTEEEIADVVLKWTGTPVSKMLAGEREKLLSMEGLLHERIVGQDAAVSAVANTVRRSRTGLSDSSKPTGSFLFLGSTGVGKTELSKALAIFCLIRMKL